MTTCVRCDLRPAQLCNECARELREHDPRCHLRAVPASDPLDVVIDEIENLRLGRVIPFSSHPAVSG